MKLTCIALFGAGYVIGAKAGRERYEQLMSLAQSVAGNLDGRKSARERVLEFADAGAGYLNTQRNGNERAPFLDESLPG